jgi:Reverse transcriptase (RNA-dependent DNA polymerase)
VDLSFLNPLPPEPIRVWVPFSLLEFREALSACAKHSAPSPDHITWSFLKHWCQAPGVLELFVSIAEACIQVGHWPSHFNESLSVIIMKPGKPNYSTPKSFWPIVLLNTLGKLFEKLLSQRLQFDSVAHGAFHPMQFGGITQCSTEDAWVYLTHLVCAGWAEGLQMSMVMFDITQFFPSINHDVLLQVIDRSGFPPCVGRFFHSYLVGRCTTYKWNTFTSGPYPADIGVGQGSALSPVLSLLCLAPILKLFSASDIGHQVNVMSYMDDGMLITHSP